MFHLEFAKNYTHARLSGSWREMVILSQSLANQNRAIVKHLVLPTWIFQLSPFSEETLEIG